MEFRNRLFISVGVVFTVFVSSVLGDVPLKVENDPRWQQAESYVEQGLHLEAAELYGQIFQEFPGSQKAALRRAIALESVESTTEDLPLPEAAAGTTAVPMAVDGAGFQSAAIAAYEAAIELKPFGYWGSVGLHKLAKLHTRRGNVETARQCINRLRERFPGTRWSARADLLEKQIDGEDTTIAEAVLAREVAAWNAFRSADKVTPGVGNEDDRRIMRLDAAAKTFVGTGAALQALETKGHLLIRNSRRDEAIEAFEEIVAQASPAATKAPVVMKAKSRIASLYHAAGRKVEALTAFDELASDAAEPEVVSNAKLQAAGLYFELLQPRRWSNEEVTADEWSEVRRRCNDVRAYAKAKPREIARADLMTLESYLWEKKPQECLDRAQAFIDSHDKENYRRELATSHLFAGESLLRLRQPAEALTHLKWITDEYENNGNIWPWDYLIERTYYRVYDALLRSGADVATIDAAAQKVLDDFPNSRSADLISASIEKRAEQAAEQDYSDAQKLIEELGIQQ